MDIIDIIPNCLEDDFVILLDDCERIGEKNTIEILEATDGEIGEFILKLTCSKTSSLEELRDSIVLTQSESEMELTLNVIQEAKVTE